MKSPRTATRVSMRSLKAFVKMSAFVVASGCVLPLLIFVGAAKRLSTSERPFQTSSQLLSLVPSGIGTYLRAAFYARICTAVDREVAIGFLTLLSHLDTDLGRNVYVGAQSNIGSCSIGRDCLLGSGVHVLSGKRQHDFSDPSVPVRKQGGRFEKIRIGENCWIGNGAIIMADVGPHCIVAAGAVVTDRVPEKSVVAGNPARVLRHR